ncbi:MAG: 2-oxoacid:acceptor oxidoreductase family protein [Elusimicrobia bacterium]|nr:2-oxoacid:acceptor oxidoreductase family protein [Candidatus Liberimonas magnetica]
MKENMISEEIIIAGFGGQGVLLTGMILAQAALEEDKHTTWFPSYGAEMRGGTANSSVIISDEEIGSPVFVNPSTLIALNEQSLNKFLPKMKNGSMIIYNSSLVCKKPNIPDVTVKPIPATELADKQIKNVRTANMITLGVFLRSKNILSLNSAKKACEKAFPDKPELIKANQAALELGYNFK